MEIRPLSKHEKMTRATVKLLQETLEKNRVNPGLSYAAALDLLESCREKLVGLTEAEHLQLCECEPLIDWEHC